MKGSIYLDEVHEVRTLPGTEVVAKGADVVGAEMYQFELCTSSRNWMLAAETDEERQQWVAQISRTASVCAGGGGAGAGGEGETAGGGMLDDILSGKTLFRGNSKHAMGAARAGTGEAPGGAEDAAAEDAAASGASGGSGKKRGSGVVSRGTEEGRSFGSRFGIGSGIRSRFTGSKSSDKAAAGEPGPGVEEEDEFDGEVDETAITAKEALP